jgi:hypothetical protein
LRKAVGSGRAERKQPEVQAAMSGDFDPRRKCGGMSDQRSLLGWNTIFKIPIPAQAK